MAFSEMIVSFKQGNRPRFCETRLEPGNATPLKTAALRVAIQCATNAAQDTIRVCLKIVFPDSDYGPARCAKFAIRVTVSLDITNQFFGPVFPIGSRHPIAFRAAMPKTTIDENDDPRLTKGEVGTARQWQMATPTDNPVLAKEVQQEEFGGFVAELANARHIE